MELQAVVSALIGAVFGSLGWLFVGLYIQRTQARAQARNACRAVAIELEMNRVNVVMARDFAAFLPLGRSAFDQLLPQLATSLVAADLRRVAAAYMCHAGYEQLRNTSGLPDEARKPALTGILKVHDEVLLRLNVLAFKKVERSGDVAGVTAPTELRQEIKNVE